MENWKTKYQVYFDKDGNITKYKKLTYTKKTNAEIRTILTNSEKFKL